MNWRAGRHHLDRAGHLFQRELRTPTVNSLGKNISQWKITQLNKLHQQLVLATLTSTLCILNSQKSSGKLPEAFVFRFLALALIVKCRSRLSSFEKGSSTTLSAKPTNESTRIKLTLNMQRHRYINEYFNKWKKCTVINTCTNWQVQSKQKNGNPMIIPGRSVQISKHLFFVTMNEYVQMVYDIFATIALQQKKTFCSRYDFVWGIMCFRFCLFFDFLSCPFPLLFAAFWAWYLQHFCTWNSFRVGLGLVYLGVGLGLGFRLV